ncbi:MAG TPA: hypothetical protein VI076_14970 [Actinopolymorphaceae bacterium]
MREFFECRRRSLICCVLLLLGLVLAPSAAHAGGPTSVLLTNPRAERATALYADDADYALLGEYLGREPKRESRAPDDEYVGPGGRQINVTWLAHDVTVWRVDHILTTDRGEIWIRTHWTAYGEAGITTEEGVWHRATQPERLEELLTRLGLTDRASTASPSPTPETAPAAAAADTDEAEATTATAAVARDSGSIGLLVALLGGGILGAVGGVLGRPALGRLGWRRERRQ